MSNPVSWFEINTANPDAMSQFYADIFGWSFQDVEGGYKLISTGGESSIGGGLGPAQGPNQVVFYVEVPDLESALQQIEQGGGHTVVPITEIPNMVTFAQFADPDGNVIGLFKGPGA
ncbi:MAG: uncharacterized protein QOF30_1771 [Acidimicrobiaceae bacterium]|nr:uncharacterized protein [Acidimicrobiaceae bacterium]